MPGRWTDGLPPWIRTLVEEPMARVALRGRLMEPYWRRRFREFGRGSIVHRPDWVYGAHQIEVGPFVVVMHGAWISVERVAWDLPGPVVRLGEGVGLRPYCTISAAEEVVIERNVMVGSFSTITDLDHTPDRTPRRIVDTPMRTAPVRIGEGTWVGERVAILRGSDIGRGCAIGANSVVKGSIPDHAIAVGAPARVIGSLLDGKG